MRLSVILAGLVASVAAQDSVDSTTGWSATNFLLNYNGVVKTISLFPGLFNRGRYHDLALLFTPDGCLHFPILNVNACGTAAVETFFADGSKIPGTNTTAQTQALFGIPEVTFRADKTAFVITEFDEYIYRSSAVSSRIDVHGSYNFTLVQAPNTGSKSALPPRWAIKDVVYDVYVSVLSPWRLFYTTAFLTCFAGSTSQLIDEDCNTQSPQMFS